MSDDSVDPAPSKKARETSPRRSDRTKRGRGGAVEQLRMVGTALARPQRRETADQFAAAGEPRNPLAPHSPSRRRKKVSVTTDHFVSALCSQVLSKLTATYETNRPEGS